MINLPCDSFLGYLLSLCHRPEILLYYIERADLLSHASYQPLSISVLLFLCIPIASSVLSSRSASHAPSSSSLSSCRAALDTLNLPNNSFKYSSTSHLFTLFYLSSPSLFHLSVFSFLYLFFLSVPFFQP